MLGVDPCRLYVERARDLTDDARVEFAVADARDLELEDGSFDTVLFHTTLCHVPEPERALAEAHRVLRPGGTLVVFDGDYVTPTVALGAYDPLQSCLEAAVAERVHDRWLVRGPARLVRDAGFLDLRAAGYAYTRVGDALYMLALVERGADVLALDGTLGPEAAEALKAEGLRRMEAGTFFGHIAYMSLAARRR
ncbi:MAG TPA: methyltransferase domain-containing protein [Gaiellaceae bacterium]